eukprot:TRINITY_DN7050_c0_g1_i3.p1 TRINITY_DN7050_c0_g1~~TRINITY_DN7050_c0_g1_i3.p1  ORF type:complete len:555 (+),score=125.49 TRINITY_DN7050_c0_g1_i3:700-2364(+)
MFVGTGISVPRRARAAQGAEHIQNYDTMSVDPENYVNKSVLILGYGNSAFETAKVLTDNAAHVWVVGKRRLRLAVETLYEGDVHASANELIDSYHLKSLDAIGEHQFHVYPSVVKDGEFLKLMSPSFVMKFIALQRYRQKQLKKKTHKTGAEGAFAEDFVKNHPEIGRKYLELRAGHDDSDGEGWSTDLWRSHILIACHGFMFNDTIFTGTPVCLSDPAECPRPDDKDPTKVQIYFLGGRVSSEPLPHPGSTSYMTSRDEDVKSMHYPDRAYPVMSELFESVWHPSMFYIGALMHANDWRNSSGGFIHGYRHLIAGLHSHLEMTRHSVPWPSKAVASTAEGMTEALVIRASNAASIFSMHRHVFDVIAVGANGTEGKLFTGVPVGAIAKIVPKKSVYLTMTFGRPSIHSDEETKERVKAAQVKALEDREEVTKINMKLGAMEDEKKPIPPELERKANAMNIAYGYQEHMTKMLSDHNPFHKDRLVQDPLEAQRGHALHPIIELHCQDLTFTYHLLESSDHDYSSIARHVIPLQNQVAQGLRACAMNTWLPDVKG